MISGLLLPRAQPSGERPEVGVVPAGVQLGGTTGQGHQRSPWRALTQMERETQPHYFLLSTRHFCPRVLAASKPRGSQASGGPHPVCHRALGQGLPASRSDYTWTETQDSWALDQKPSYTLLSPCPLSSL